MESNLFKNSNRHVPITDQHGGICLHPSDQNTAEWQLSVRVSVVLRVADQAVKTKKLSPLNALILNMVVSEGMDVDEVSAKICVSDNAIYEQLRRVRKVLPEIIRTLEP